MTQAFARKRKNRIISDAVTTWYPSDPLWFNKNIGIAVFKKISFSDCLLIKSISGAILYGMH